MSPMFYKKVCTLQLPSAPRRPSANQQLRRGWSFSVNDHPRLYSRLFSLENRAGKIPMLYNILCDLVYCNSKGLSSLQCVVNVQKIDVSFWGFLVISASLTTAL